MAKNNLARGVMMTNKTLQLPVLYSFRRCPYAMRARVALAQADHRVELREVLLRDKPEQMLTLSPKATVPVLHLADTQILDESLDIMHWALQRNDPDGWLRADSELTRELIAENDGPFKDALDRYKYHTRHPEQPREHYRAQGEQFLHTLETRLEQNGGAGLCRNTLSLADAAIFPFIRQFAGADVAWFATAPYPYLRGWLNHLVNAPLFLRVMRKRKPWQAGQASIIEDWSAPES